MSSLFRAIILCILIIGAPALVVAHGGAHKKAPASVVEELPVLEEIPMDSAGGGTYGFEDVGESEDAPTGSDGDLFSFSEGDQAPIDLRSPQNTGDPMTGHDMANMKTVELDHHEWVSPSSSKGYGFAVAITLFSGALFGFLMIKRPLE